MQIIGKLFRTITDHMKGGVPRVPRLSFAYRFFARGCMHGKKMRMLARCLASAACDGALAALP